MSILFQDIFEIKNLGTSQSQTELQPNQEIVKIWKGRNILYSEIGCGSKIYTFEDYKK